MTGYVTYDFDKMENNGFIPLPEIRWPDGDLWGEMFEAAEKELEETAIAYQRAAQTILGMSMHYLHFRGINPGWPVIRRSTKTPYVFETIMFIAIGSSPINQFRVLLRPYTKKGTPAKSIRTYHLHVIFDLQSRKLGRPGWPPRPYEAYP